MEKNVTPARSRTSMRQGDQTGPISNWRSLKSPTEIPEQPFPGLLLFRALPSTEEPRERDLGGGMERAVPNGRLLRTLAVRGSVASLLGSVVLAAFITGNASVAPGGSDTGSLPRGATSARLAGRCHNNQIALASTTASGSAAPTPQHAQPTSVDRIPVS